jgi:hypothetical protein
VISFVLVYVLGLYAFGMAFYYIHKYVTGEPYDDLSWHGGVKKTMQRLHSRNIL